MATKRTKTGGVQKPAATTAPKLRTATKPKTAARPKAAAKPARKAIARAAAVRQEDIAFRAYLIGEKRQQLGLPGDPLSDWVEAERQLLGERSTHGVN